MSSTSSDLETAETTPRILDPTYSWSSNYPAAPVYAHGRNQSQGLGLLERLLQCLHGTFNWFRDGALAAPRTIPENASILPIPDCLRADEDGIGLVVETIGSHAVGLGGHSDVWKGRITRSRAEAFTGNLVAIKVLRQFSENSRPNGLRKHLQQEVRVWTILDHENIAGFHGVVYNSNGAPGIISPWYANGSADVYLRLHPDANPMKIIQETVSGVEYLHEHGIVHGDLKGTNIMVDEDDHAKLIDFGLSRIIDSVTGSSGFTMSLVSVSIRWCAPELVLAESAQVTKASDIYACASTALELLTGEVPYSSQRELPVLWAVMNKITPQRPAAPLTFIDNSDELWELLEECWSEAPRRPSISEVKRRMRVFYPTKLDFQSALLS